MPKELSPEDSEDYEEDDEDSFEEDDEIIIEENEEGKEDKDFLEEEELSDMLEATKEYGNRRIGSKISELSKLQRLAIGGIIVLTVGVAGYGAYNYLLPKHNPKSETTQEIVLSPEQRLAQLDSLSRVLSYKDIDSALIELACAQRSANQSSYEEIVRPSIVIDSLDARLKRANEETSGLRRTADYLDSLAQSWGFVDAEGALLELHQKDTTPQAVGYSQDRLDKDVRAAKIQGIASGYDRGLQEGKINELTQIFSLISPKVKEFTYIRAITQSSIEYSVSPRAVPLKEPELTRGILETFIKDQEKTATYLGELMGLGVRQEDIKQYLDGEIGLQLTVNPITGEVMSVVIEDLEGDIVGSYKPIRSKGGKK